MARGRSCPEWFQLKDEEVSCPASLILNTNQDYVLDKAFIWGVDLRGWVKTSKKAVWFIRWALFEILSNEGDLTISTSTAGLLTLLRSEVSLK